MLAVQTRSGSQAWSSTLSCSGRRLVDLGWVASADPTLDFVEAALVAEGVEPFEIDRPRHGTGSRVDQGCHRTDGHSARGAGLWVPAGGLAALGGSEVGCDDPGMVAALGRRSEGVGLPPGLHGQIDRSLFDWRPSHTGRVTDEEALSRARLPALSW